MSEEAHVDARYKGRPRRWRLVQTKIKFKENEVNSILKKSVDMVYLITLTSKRGEALSLSLAKKLLAYKHCKWLFYK